MFEKNFKKYVKKVEVSLSSFASVEFWIFWIKHSLQSLFKPIFT